MSNFVPFDCLILIEESGFAPEISELFHTLTSNLLEAKKVSAEIEPRWDCNGVAGNAIARRRAASFVYGYHVQVQRPRPARLRSVVGEQVFPVRAC